MLRNPIVESFDLPNVDAAFTLHYDETNNIRRLHVTPNGFNVRRPQCFVLGGIAHRGPAPDLTFLDIRSALGLQPSSKELKLEQLGRGDFMALLNSARIEAFLKWLDRQHILVHYQVLDPLYWSIVDVIDSIVDEHDSRQLMMLAPALKNDLYALLRGNGDQTAELFGRYNYPNVGAAGREPFIAELLDLVETRQHRLQHFNYQMLKGALQVAQGLDRLPYLEDESPNVLIDGFGAFYLNRIALFKNATHVLDIEVTIERYLTSLDLRDGERPMTNFEFVESKDHPWVQVADAVAGLLGKLFSYANANEVDDIEAALLALNARQRNSLDVLTGLIDRSAELCPGFIHYVTSLDDQRRRVAILGF